MSWDCLFLFFSLCKSVAFVVLYLFGSVLCCMSDFLFRDVYFRARSIFRNVLKITGIVCVYINVAQLR